MASTAEIKAQLQAAIEQANEASGAIGASMSQLETAVASGMEATQETSSALPGEAIGQYQQARERLEEVLGLIQAANGTFEQYMNTI